MSGFNFDFNFPTFSQTMDEERSTADPRSEPFSWQLATSSGPFSWEQRDRLNDELTENVQRTFEFAVDNGFVSPAMSPPWQEPSPEATQAPPDVPPPAAQPQPQPLPGYMQQSSAFAFDSSPAELEFLEWYPPGNATLSFQNDQDETETISNLNIDIISERCAIIGHAFEPSRSGPQVRLDILTSATALPFLRYLYTGTYALKGPTEDFYEDVPTSVLFHAQLFRLGDIYDLPDLKSQAYVNILRQCEFGCSSPNKPIDLCPAIRYIYDNLAKYDNLIDAIINYCVSCFLQHSLAEDENFKKLAYELRPFHQDLCKNSMNRQFENETATAIIQMPFKPYVPETYASRDDPAATRFGKMEDVVFHFHANDEMDCSSKKRKRPEKAPVSSDSENTTLPIRTLQTPLGEIKQESGIAGMGYKAASKRRASSAAGSSQPTAVAVSTAVEFALPLHPRRKQSGSPEESEESEEEYYKVERAIARPTPLARKPSDGEFEVVAGPSAVLDASDSDSDSSTLVEVKYEEVDQLVPGAANATSVVEAADSDAESDWTLV